jgi:hypothetical protein
MNIRRRKNMTRRSGRKWKPRGRLPDSVELSVDRVSIETRTRPRVVKEAGRQSVRIRDGVATVLDPGTDSLTRRGTCFKVENRKVIAKKVTVKPQKFRGSRSHHKFIMVLVGVLFPNT